MVSKMHDTQFRKALIQLCKRHPELRKKLACELARHPKCKTFSKKVGGPEENYMIVQSLMKIGERGPQILEMIGADADELEDWQEFKVHLAAEYLDAVYDSLRYRPEDL